MLHSFSCAKCVANGTSKFTTKLVNYMDKDEDMGFYSNRFYGSTLYGSA